MSSEKKNARPWDLLDPSVKHVPDDVYIKRYEECLTCKSFNRIMGVCKHCLCIMKVKCSLAHAYCPENKWEEHKEERDTI